MALKEGQITNRAERIDDSHIDFFFIRSVGGAQLSAAVQFSILV